MKNGQWKTFSLVCYPPPPEAPKVVNAHIELCTRVSASYKYSLISQDDNAADRGQLGSHGTDEMQTSYTSVSRTMAPGIHVRLCVGEDASV